MNAMRPLGLTHRHHDVDGDCDDCDCLPACLPACLLDCLLAALPLCLPWQTSFAASASIHPSLIHLLRPSFSPPPPRHPRQCVTRPSPLPSRRKQEHALSQGQKRSGRVKAILSSPRKRDCKRITLLRLLSESLFLSSYLYNPIQFQFKRKKRIALFNYHLL